VPASPIRLIRLLRRERPSVWNALVPSPRAPPPSSWILAPSSFALTSHAKLLSPFLSQGCPRCSMVAVRLGFFPLPLAELLSPLALGLTGRVSYLVIEILFFGLERVLFGRPLIIKQAKCLFLSSFVLCVRGWPWRRLYRHRSWPC